MNDDTIMNSNDTLCDKEFPGDGLESEPFASTPTSIPSGDEPCKTQETVPGTTSTRTGSPLPKLNNESLLNALGTNAMTTESHNKSKKLKMTPGDKTTLAIKKVTKVHDGVDGPAEPCMGDLHYDLCNRCLTVAEPWDRKRHAHVDVL